jgi:DNA N-6-adenine-methyltransferase (Dam)
VSIGGHHNPVAQKDEWLTPPHVLRALGIFDLDPCAPVARPWDTAARHFTVEDDGLAQAWHGRVWCNPPYGLAAARWLCRCAEHGNAIALVFARTETRMFFDHVWPKAHGLLFLDGRLHFHHVTGERAPMNSGAPSVLIAYGVGNALTLQQCGLLGAYVERPVIGRARAAA